MLPFELKSILDADAPNAFAHISLAFSPLATTGQLWV
jgi:hypothetical protein